MTNATLPLAAPRAPLALPLLALTQTLLFLVPMIVLGQAIGWPGSLRLPAAEVLPLIAREALAVQIGYWAYLLVSVALVPLAVALGHHARAHGAGGPLVDSAVALGVTAGVLKTLGIVRWLVAMPALATLHAQGDAPTRAMVEIAFTTLNGYAGAVGELLGVQLFSGLWLVLTGLVLARIGHVWIGRAGLAIGALFVATCLRTIVPEMAALQGFAVPLALFWFPLLAWALWRRG